MDSAEVPQTQFIGQNFSDFLIGMRIDYAKQLLRESDVTVQRISEMMGDVNPTSFIRVFKRLVGLSPGQYREAETKHPRAARE